MIKLLINSSTLVSNKEDLMKSDYFKTLLNGNWKENDQIKIVDPIEDKENRTVEIIFTLTSLSNKFPEITNENFHIYFQYGHYFQVKNLIEKCEQFVIKSVNQYTPNIIEYLKIISKVEPYFEFYYGCLYFLKCFSYISEKYLELFLFEEEILEDIFKDTNFYFNNEKDKYDFCKAMVKSLKNRYINNSSMPENIKKLIKIWTESINYSQLLQNGISIFQIIKDDFLDMETLKYISANELNSPKKYSYKNYITFSNILVLQCSEEFKCNNINYKLWCEIENDTLALYLNYIPYCGILFDERNKSININIEIFGIYYIEEIKNYQLRIQKDQLSKFNPQSQKIEIKEFSKIKNYPKVCNNIFIILTLTFVNKNL